MNDEDLMHSMRIWAIENNLVKEFDEEILNSPYLNAWKYNDALVRRFGYFVLEHTVDV